MMSLTHLLTMPNLNLFSPSGEMLEDRIRVTAFNQLNRRHSHHAVYLGSIHNTKRLLKTLCGPAIKRRSGTDGD